MSLRKSLFIKMRNKAIVNDYDYQDKFNFILKCIYELYRV